MVPLLERSFTKSNDSWAIRVDSTLKVTPLIPLCYQIFIILWCLTIQTANMASSLEPSQQPFLRFLTTCVCAHCYLLCAILLSEHVFVIILSKDIIWAKGVSFGIMHNTWCYQIMFSHRLFLLSFFVFQNLLCSPQSCSLSAKTQINIYI